jgi:hypothetical protein
MANSFYINDDDLNSLFKNKIIQQDNYNSCSTLFIYDDKVLKVYDEDNEFTKFNLNVIKNIINKKSYLSNIEELVLPKELLIYNDKIVGYTMPYIKGITLDEAIKNNLFNDDEMKNIFIKLLNTINKFDKLPFKFSIGDMHEKNIIIDKNHNINIIDSDSFIIDNNKLLVDDNYLVGKYVNHFYDNDQLEKIGSTTDYYSLLCIILNYVYKDIIEDKMNPITWAKEEKQFAGIHPILNKVDEEFILTENDINDIFDFKKNLNYIYKENNDLIKVIKKIRKELSNIS